MNPSPHALPSEETPSGVPLAFPPLGSPAFPSPQTALDRSSSESRWAWRSLIFLNVLVLSLFLLRLSGPPHLAGKDQERPISYIFDILHNGHWLVQRDWTGDIMSKPPLFQWLAALASLPFGSLSIASLYFPCLLACLLTVNALFLTGRHFFGWRTGLSAGALFLLCPAGMKHLSMARADGIFSAFVFLTALSAFWAWQRGKGWTWVGLTAALATFAKGPLGLLLGCLGLCAVFWETSELTPVRLRGRPWIGFVLWGSLVGGWFAWAYAETGPPLIAKIIHRELVHHAVGEGRLGRGLWETPFYFLTRFAPWSLIAIPPIFFTFRRRPWPTASHPESTRRFLRFLSCWVLGGLCVFALASHQRSDLVLPLVPAAALLAATQLNRWLARFSPQRFAFVITGCCLLWTGASSLYYHTAFAHREETLRTQGMAQLARTIHSRLGENTPVLQLDAPFSLQFYLHQWQPQLSWEALAERLHKGHPITFAVQDLSALRSVWKEPLDTLEQVASWPAEGTPQVYIFRSHPTFATQSPSSP